MRQSAESLRRLLSVLTLQAKAKAVAQVESEGSLRQCLRKVT